MIQHINIQSLNLKPWTRWPVEQCRRA